MGVGGTRRVRAFVVMVGVVMVGVVFVGVVMVGVVIVGVPPSVVIRGEWVVSSEAAVSVFNGTEDKGKAPEGDMVAGLRGERRGSLGEVEEVVSVSVESSSSLISWEGGTAEEAVVEVGEESCAEEHS